MLIQGVFFLLKFFFGHQIFVSASETISNESSYCYKDFYELEKTQESEEKKEFTAVSFDGKGVHMIKKEAVKIIGRQGKGNKIMTL